MKIRVITILVLAALMLSLLTACNDDASVITPEKAQEIALEDAGLSAKDVTDVHTHVSSYEDVACYSIHITVDGTEYEYMIAAGTGEILYSEDIQ